MVGSPASCAAGPCCPAPTSGLYVGTVDVTGNPLRIWLEGTVNLDGGTLHATTLDHANFGTFNFTDGTLIVDTCEGKLDQDGGTLSPGISPGTTNITGGYNPSAGALAIEIGGTTPGTQFDRVEVDGIADLRGELDVTLIDGFTPAAGDSLGFLSANGGFNAGFSALNLPDLSAQNLAWQLNPGGSTLFLAVVAAGITGDYNG